MSFPSSPWDLRGQVWASLFYATGPEGPDTRRRVYAAAFVAHEAGSTLPHRALLVARRVRDAGRRAFEVVDGWVDDEQAAGGYRSAFGFPVRAGRLTVDAGGLGPVGRAEWTLTADDVPVAGAHFGDTAGIAPRTPLRLDTRQPRPGGPIVAAPVGGSARTVPCLAAWTIPAESTLGWLAGAQPFASFRLRDARLSLG